MRRLDHNGKKAGAISGLRHGYCRMGSKDETRLAILSVIHLCDGSGSGGAKRCCYLLYGKGKNTDIR